MQDRQLYEQILGITAPWFVERVELKLEEESVYVQLAHRADAAWHCPQGYRITLVKLGGRDKGESHMLAA